MAWNKVFAPAGQDWVGCWKHRLLGVTLFSILGLQFLQQRTMPVITLLSFLVLATVLADAQKRQTLVGLFCRPGQTLDTRWISWPFLGWFLTDALLLICTPQPISSQEVKLLDLSLRFPVALGLLALAAGEAFPHRAFIWSLLAAALAAGGISAYSLITGSLLVDNRVTGWMNWPLHFGNWSVMVAMLLTLFSALSVNLSVRWRLVLLLAAVLAFLASASSISRSSLLPLPVFAALLLMLRKDSFHRRLVSLGLVVILLLGVSVLMSPVLQHKMRLAQAVNDLDKARSEQMYDTSLGGRLVMWGAAWTMFKEHPFAGVGISAFQPTLKHMVERKEVPHIGRDYRQAHSDFMHLLATGGVLRGLPYLSIVLGPLVFFVLAFRRAGGDPNQRLYAVAGVLTVCAFIAFGLTSFNLRRLFYSATYPLLVCVLTAALLPQLRSGVNPTSPRFQ